MLTYATTVKADYVAHISNIAPGGFSGDYQSVGRSVISRPPDITLESGLFLGLQQVSYLMSAIGLTLKGKFK